MRTPAKTMPHVKLDIHRKNIAVCVFLDSPVKTVKAVSTVSNAILFSNSLSPHNVSETINGQRWTGNLLCLALYNCCDYFTEKDQEFKKTLS